MLTPLFCRLTPAEQTDQIENLKKIFQEKYQSGIISRETDANRIHYHVFLMTTDTVSKNARQNLKNYVNRVLGLEGNSQFAITKCSADVEKLKSYVVKEGNFIYWGFTPEEIQTYVEKSYRKEKTTYKAELKELESKIKEIPISELIDEYFRLRIKYKKPTTYYQAKNYIEWMCISSSEKYLFKTKLRISAELNLNCYSEIHDADFFLK